MVSRTVRGFAAIFFGALFFGSAAWAGNGEGLRLLPGGLVFPEYNESSYINAGALAQEGEKALQGLYSPDAFGSNPEGYGLNTTFTSPSYGLGVGYRAVLVPTTVLEAGYRTTEIYGGAGFRSNQLGIGLNYRRFTQSDSTLPPDSSLDLGMILGNGKGTNFAAILASLDSSTYLKLGAGYLEPGRYNLEINLELPGFETGMFSAGARYVLRFAAGAYAGPFGMAFTTFYTYTVGERGTPDAYLLRPLSLAHGVALLARISKDLGLTLRFDSQNHLTLGLNLRF